jgi:hypothetical protein
MNRITIGAPVLEVRGDTARLRATITLPEGTTILWFETDANEARHFVTDTLDGFVLGLLPLAATRGLDLHAAGPMSSRLHYSLNSYVNEVLRSLIPGARRIGVSADALTTTHWGGQGVYTGFSAGIDSFCTILHHLSNAVPPEYRVSALLLNNVGSHGQTRRDLEIFRNRYRRIKPHADQLHLPFVAVNSNLDEVLQLNFQLTHTLRNAAVALLFQRDCAKYLYSATVHYTASHVQPTYDMGYADPITVPLLSTETTQCISSGAQYTRFDKTKLVSDFPPSYTALDVCVDPGHARLINCSKCWKCLRTELTLEIIGALDRYQPVFEADAYRQLRTLYMAWLLQSDHPLSAEIRQAMSEARFPIPATARLLASLMPARVMKVALDEASRLGSASPPKLVPRIGRRVARKVLTLRGRPPA